MEYSTALPAHWFPVLLSYGIFMFFWWAIIKRVFEYKNQKIQLNLNVVAISIVVLWLLSPVINYVFVGTMEIWHSVDMNHFQYFGSLLTGPILLLVTNLIFAKKES